jgi:hypothetical protein
MRERIILDGDDGTEIQPLTALGRGLPAITLHGYMSSMLADELVSISSTIRVMEAVATILRYGAGGAQDQSCSTLVQELIRLIRTLGWAAEVMKRSQQF